MPRYAGTFFRYKDEPQKVYGKNGLENGSTIPLGFEVGDRIRLCINRAGFPTFEIVLREDTFAGDTVSLPDGTEADTHELWTVMRIESEGDELP